MKRAVPTMPMTWGKASCLEEKDLESMSASEHQKRYTTVVHATLSVVHSTVKPLPMPRFVRSPLPTVRSSRFLQSERAANDAVPAILLTVRNAAFLEEKELSREHRGR